MRDGRETVLSRAIKSQDAWEWTERTREYTGPVFSLQRLDYQSEREARFAPDKCQPVDIKTRKSERPDVCAPPLSEPADLKRERAFRQYSL